MYFVSTDIYIRTFVSSNLQHKRFCHTFTIVQIILFRTSKHTEDYQTRTTCEFMNKKYLNKSIRKKATHVAQPITSKTSSQKRIHSFTSFSIFPTFAIISYHICCDKITKYIASKNQK